MNRTEYTLLEQLRITELELEERKQLFGITQDTATCLRQYQPAFERVADAVVARFYQHQTAIPEIALLIGDADTLARLREAQGRYVRDLFRGVYDLDYVNGRLRIGLVHHRIGVDPRLYLSAMQTLQSLLFEFLRKVCADRDAYEAAATALGHLMAFDVSLVFDTYIRGLVSAIEVSRERSERYAAALEVKVRERTDELERLSCTDPLTGLMNRRHLHDLLDQALRRAERHREPLTVAYFDIDAFKPINDTQGHQRGDEVLQQVARRIREASRVDDACFRYGGDEFCVILSGCTVAQAAAIYEPRLRQELRDIDTGLGISIGYAQAGPHEYPLPEALIRLADERMYAAKQDPHGAVTESQHNSGTR